MHTTNWACVCGCACMHLCMSIKSVWVFVCAHECLLVWVTVCVCMCMHVYLYVGGEHTNQCNLWLLFIRLQGKQLRFPLRLTSWCVTPWLCSLSSVTKAWNPSSITILGSRNFSLYPDSFSRFSDSPGQTTSAVKTCTPQCQRFTVFRLIQLVQRQPWTDNKHSQNRLNMHTTMSTFHHTLNHSSTALDKVQLKPAIHAHHNVNISPYSESFINSPGQRQSTIKTSYTCTPQCQHFTILWIIHQQPWTETKYN